MPVTGVTTAFQVTFWGVRGTMPCPLVSHVGFGGNTSCVEVRAGERSVILDCGTGLRALGRHMLEQGLHEATILLSHTHLDHISGFPFFEPIFRPDCRFHVMAARYASASMCGAGLPCRSIPKCSR